MDPPAVVHAYLLEGTLDERPVQFYVPLGEHGIGARSTNEVHLPLSGVSREHARLIATATGLIVEDRGSTNGTFVNGKSVTRATVPAGACLRLGPAELTLQTLTERKDRLAFALDPPKNVTPMDAAKPKTLEHPTAIHPIPDAVSDAATAIERLLHRCAWSGPADTIEQALDVITAFLPHVDLCGVWWRANEAPVVLGCRGVPHTVPAHSELSRSGHNPPPVMGVSMIESLGDRFNTRTLFSVHASAAGRCGIVLWPPHASTSGLSRHMPLLRTAVRLIERCVASAPVPQARPSPGALAWPPGTCRCPSVDMRRLEHTLETAARGNLPVLVLGETGVGKELIARMVHQHSSRAHGPLVTINCAALPSHLMEAELFGIGRGVATGVTPRPGQFARAEGGTLFLDEIGELDRQLQAKLLRALQDGEIQPLGEAPRRVDVRIVAATNRSHESLRVGDTLRPDLFFRLAGMVLEVPPLRQRPEDVRALVEHFVRVANATHDLRIRGVTSGALEQLLAYPWPGNVRELEHEIRRAAAMANSQGDHAVIHEGCLSKPVRDLSPVTPDVLIQTNASLDLRSAVKQLERAFITEALIRTSVQKAPAARLLGVSRSGFEGRLQRLSISTAHAKTS